MSVRPAFQYADTDSTIASRSGPQGIDEATSSGRTNWLAAANPAGVGRSALTDHPPPNHRNCSWASSVPSSSVGAQQIRIWSMARARSPIRLAPSTPFHASTISADGSTAIRWSPIGARVSTARSPPTATPISTGRSGRSHTRAESTWKYSPRWSTSSPVCRRRMISTASASMAWRVCSAGHPRPTTCSFRFSPAPTPSTNRPSDSTPRVAACWATSAGW